MEAVRDKGADIIAMSALLTTTMPGMKDTVEAVKAAGLEVVEVNHQGEWVSVTARKN